MSAIKEISPSESRQALLKKLERIVSDGEMTKEGYEQMKNLVVAPGWTVAQLIKTNIDVGQLEWQGERLMLNSKVRANGHK